MDIEAINKYYEDLRQQGHDPKLVEQSKRLFLRLCEDYTSVFAVFRQEMRFGQKQLALTVENPFKGIHKEHAAPDIHTTIEGGSIQLIYNGERSNDEVFDELFVEYQHKINSVIFHPIEAWTDNSCAVESIDHLISSYSEIWYCDLRAGSGDPYGNTLFDRDAGASFWDGYVKFGYEWNAETKQGYHADLRLTTKLFGEMDKRDTDYNYEDKNDQYVIITGPDTFEWINQQHFIDWTKTITKNGMIVGQYKRRPVLVYKQVKKDRLSRIYHVNLTHMYLAIFQPLVISAQESGFLLSMNIQLVCDKFVVQTKIRDLVI